MTQPFHESGGRSSDQVVQGLEWFDTLYTLYHRRAYGLAYTILGEPNDAQDAVQEAFLSLWRSGKMPDPAAEATRNLLFATVRNRAIDAVRARRRHAARALDPGVDPVDSADVPREIERSADQRMARHVLERLPSEQREVMELAYLGGYSHAEIASRLGLPLGTVKSRIRLAMDRLRALLSARADPSISA